MYTFGQYIINEMPKKLKIAAQQGDAENFNLELVDAYNEVKKRLESPKDTTYDVHGAENIEVHQPDDEHVYPYMTFSYKAPAGSPDVSTKRVKICVSNSEDVKSINDFEFYVNEKKKTFNVTKAPGPKKVGDIEAGPTYILVGIKQALASGKEVTKPTAVAKPVDLSKLSLEELEKELEKRRKQ